MAVVKGPMRSRQRHEYWRQIVMGQPGSGQSIRQWCRQQGVREPSFYAWRRELARRDAQQQACGLTPPARFVAVDLAGAEQPSTPGPLLQLVVNDLRVEIAPGFDVDTLRRLVTVLREASAC
jgi:hypothetical protein